jgi:hypothetical protein
MRQLVRPLLLSFDRIMAWMRVLGEADGHTRKNRLGLRTVVSVVEVKDSPTVEAVTQAEGETVPD